ncbi:MAG: FkbM family methyltransferase [Paracoccaceae bacterium]|nr:FkbM family methyltransferase [Paracoccaceae bacterium]
MRETFTSPQVQVVRTTVLGEEIFFSVDQPGDAVQSHHLKGRFYEADELLIMSKAFPKGGRFLDIGANTGNHSLFFGRIMGASRILPIEVNPRIIGLLKSNLILNRLDGICDLRHLGLGLHSRRLEGASISFRERNIGGAKVSPDGGDLTLVTGDDILDSAFDLVKIDVEGSEMDVLLGMERFIGQFRPTMFIEVNNTNAERFFDWIRDNDYVVSDEFRRYKGNCNYLILPATEA